MEILQGLRDNCDQKILSAVARYLVKLTSINWIKTLSVASFLMFPAVVFFLKNNLVKGVLNVNLMAANTITL